LKQSRKRLTNLSHQQDTKRQDFESNFSTFPRVTPRDGKFLPKVV